MMLLKVQETSTETTKFSLSHEFWSGFFEQCWGKYPRILKKPFSRLLVTREEAFGGLVQGSDQYRKEEHGNPISFFVEYAKQIVDVQKYLPNNRDDSVEEYAKRVDELLDGRKFGLIAEHFQIYDSNIWFRIREFLHGLYEFTGLPGEDTKATVFLGNYDRTPLGLHKGNSHNFMFVLQGRKRIRLWPRNYFTKSDHIEHSIEYEKYLEDSILLEGKPGDVLYWPSGYWHIGESAQDRELSMGVSLAIFMEPKRSFLGWNTIARLLNAKLESAETESHTPFNVLYPYQSVELLPALTKQSQLAIQELAYEPSLGKAVEVSALNYLTATGFTRVPVLSFDERLDESDMIAGVEGSPILWIPWIDDQLICSVNGHAFTMPDSEDYVELLKKLNRGSCRTVRKFISNCEMPEIAFHLLKKLLSLRGITVIRD